MRYTDYNNIIFEGLEYHRKYFEQFITRCLKKAEIDLITDVEFLGRMVDVLNHNQTELIKIFSAKMEDFHKKITIENIQLIIEDGPPKLENIFIEINNYNPHFKGKLGFEDIELIRNTILKIAEIQSIPIDLKNEILQIELESIKPKILVLRELKIIELLKKKFTTNSKIAECIGVLINEKPSSIRGLISNIDGQTDNTSNPENIRALESAIISLNQLGCKNEVLNLQTILARKYKLRVIK